MGLCVPSHRIAGRHDCCLIGAAARFDGCLDRRPDCSAVVDELTDVPSRTTWDGYVEGVGASEIGEPFAAGNEDVERALFLHLSILPVASREAGVGRNQHTIGRVCTTVGRL